MHTTLYLIRHGKTEGDDGRKRYKGTLDVPLSDEGRAQALAAAGLLKKLLEDREISAIYTSGMQRAMGSADAIGGTLGKRPVVVKELSERSFGVWEGMSFEDIERDYPEEFGAWRTDPYRFSPPAGESTGDVLNRVMPAIDDIVKRHHGEDVAVVAHGGVNRVILCSLLGVPLENIFYIDQDYAGISIVEFGGRKPLIKGINIRPW